MDIVSRIATDPIQVLWENFREKETAWVNAGTPAKGEVTKAMKAAHDHFIDAPTASQTGIILKIEYLVDAYGLKRALRENPNLADGRLVMGLLASLKAERDRSSS